MAEYLSVGGTTCGFQVGSSSPSNSKLAEKLSKRSYLRITKKLTEADIKAWTFYPTSWITKILGMLVQVATSFIFAPTDSQRCDISFINEIFAARNALLAYLINSAVSRFVITIGVSVR